MKRVTNDRALTHDDMTILTADQISENREMTPEGYMLCRNVPIARAGSMIYGPDQTPVPVGPNGWATISRRVEELFKPETLASFNGKPVTNEHPANREVTPKTFREMCVGITLDPRKGFGEYADCIVADLLIMDQQTIDDINAGKREVSAGYMAEYVMGDEPGLGFQTDILGNHVALVRRGRCGPRCAINDHATEEGKTMPQPKSVTVKKPARVRAMSPADRAALAKQIATDTASAAMEALGLGEGGEDVESGSGDGDIHIHFHNGETGGDATTAKVDGQDDEVDSTKDGGGDEAAKAAALAAANGNGDAGGDINTRVAAIEAAVAKIQTMLAGKTGDADEEPPTEPKKEDDMDKKDEPTNDAATGDSRALETDYKGTLAAAEILVPGFRMPTFDSAAPRVKTVDNICSARRRAVALAYSTADGQKLINTVHGIANDSEYLDVDALDCPAVATLFKAAVGAKKLMNNKANDSAATVKGRQTNDGRQVPAKKSGPKSIAELNALNTEFYGQRK